MAQTDVTERTAIVTYTLLRELQRLLQQAPGIVLKTDAHVSEAQITGVLPVLQALGDHLGHLADYLAATAPASSGASALQPL
jgi:hypothetical protein